MKRLITPAIFCLMSLIQTLPVYAQSGFYYDIHGGTSNIWSNTVLSAANTIVNAFLPYSVSKISYSYDIFRITNDGEKTAIDSGTPYGFKAKDIFSHISQGMKFGWASEMFPIGIYASCSYEHERFALQFDSNINEWEKYKMHSIRPGIGLRITPLYNSSWSPIAEISTSYNYYFKCKAPFQDDMNQFNNGGMVYTFSLGACLVDNMNAAFTAGVDWYQYSIFNREFSPDGISHPYEKMKSSRISIFISLALAL